MRHTTTGAAVAAVLLLTLTACSGSGSGADPKTGPSAEAASTPAADPAEKAAADGTKELEAAVRAYSDAYFAPDAKAAYSMLSQRCQDAYVLEIFEPAVKAAASDYGKQEIESLTVDRAADGMARVSYTYAVPTLSQKQQPWTLEGKTWKYDAC
ncbi:hypothetical protein [Streptomyces sp. NPDC020141]|uniref:hypothetical protein n=1 Tax=Streptomyces sp. NPDC020141 TaxID=3365065 RepID=UPI00379D1F05